MSGRGARAALTATALLAVAAACVVALHVLPTGVAPVARRLSEYALGPYGVLMTLAFLAAGCALLSLALGVHRTGTAPGIARLVPAMLAVAGAGMILSGIFATDPREPPSFAETVHSRASGSAFLLLIATALLRSITASRQEQVAPLTRPAAALAGAAAVTGALSSLLHDTAWAGAGQRLLVVVLTAWLLLTAYQVVRVVSPYARPVDASTRRFRAEDPARGQPRNVPPST